MRMKRRNLLKGVAASSVATTGAVGASGASLEPDVKLGTVEEYDRLRVVSDGETVDTVESPTWEKVKAAESNLDADQRLVSPDEDCVAACESNCPCKPCLVGCFNCCNPDESKCDCCSEFENPDEVACCEGC